MKYSIQNNHYKKLKYQDEVAIQKCIQGDGASFYLCSNNLCLTLRNSCINLPRNSSLLKSLSVLDRSFMGCQWSTMYTATATVIIAQIVLWYVRALRIYSTPYTEADRRCFITGIDTPCRVWDQSLLPSNHGLNK